MTKVKICGITNLEDALLSAKFGADALGFNFYERSPRYIAPEKAREIIEQLPKEILTVGVFVNKSLEKIAEIAQIAKLDALQLHGEETPEFARELKAQTNLEIIKAFRVSPEFKPEDVLQYEVDAILLDAYDPKEHGGTGHTFDWKITNKVKEICGFNSKIYLAGGLSHDNVWNAIQLREPFAVDACSKIEFEKGKKDKTKLINFIAVVRNTDKNGKLAENFDSFVPIPTIKTLPAEYFYNLLEGIQIFRLFHLPDKSITQLWTYLNGFDVASRSFGVSFHNGKFFPVELNAWIKGKFNREDYAFGWNRVILEECKGDEERAFDLFFALLEEFKLEKEDFSNE